MSDAAQDERESCSSKVNMSHACDWMLRMTLQELGAIVGDDTGMTSQ